MSALHQLHRVAAALLLVVGPAMAADTVTLAQAVQIAIAKHPEVAVERLNRDSAQVAIKAARGAFDPVLRMDAGLRDARTPSASPFEAPNGRLVERAWTQSIGISQRLGVWGARLDAGFSNARNRTSNPFVTLNPFHVPRLTANLAIPLLRNRGLDPERAELRVQRKQGEMSQLALEAKLTEVVARVEAAYYDLAVAEESLTVARRLASVAESSLRATERLAEVGTLPQADVAGARSRWAQANEALAAAEAQHGLAEMALKEWLVEGPLDPLWREKLQVRRPATQALEEAASAGRDHVAEALKNRVELRLAAGQQEIAATQERLAAEQLKPQVDLNVGIVSQGLAGRAALPGGSFFGIDLTVPPALVGGTQRAAAQVGRFDFPTVTAGLSFELPLGNRAAEARAKQAQLAKVRQQREQERWQRQVVREVMQALVVMEAARRRVTAAEEASAQARLRLDSELRLLDGGKSNNLNVNIRQSETSDAEQRRVAAQRAWLQASSDLRRASASALEHYGIKVE